MSSSKGKWIAAAFVVVGIAISIFRSCDSSAPVTPAHVGKPNSARASVPASVSGSPSQGAKDRMLSDLAAVDSISDSLVDRSSDSLAASDDRHVVLDSTTHYYAVSSQFVTDSFQVEGGARFDSGDSVSARVSFPGPQFSLQLFPGLPQPKLPTPGDLPTINPFQARYNAFIGTGTESLISIGLGADLDIMDQIRLSGEAELQILPLDASAKARIHYLF